MLCDFCLKEVKDHTLIEDKNLSGIIICKSCEESDNEEHHHNCAWWKDWHACDCGLFEIKAPSSSG